MNSHKILFVLTSHDTLGNTGNKTGFWLEEFAAPYYKLKDKGIDITIATPKGGLPPIDPKSESSDSQTEATKRYDKDPSLQQKLSNTVKLSEVKADGFEAVFYPGGHGPLWDLTNDTHSINLLQSFVKQKKPIATVCHGPAVLINVKDENGNSIVKSKKVTGFSNSEEEGVKLTKVVPFLVEDRLKELGADYSKKDDWKPYVVQDGLLITGQNPASSEPVAEALLKLLQK